MWMKWKAATTPVVKPGSVAIMAFSMRPIEPNNLQRDDALLEALLLDEQGNSYAWPVWYHLPMNAFYLLDERHEPMPCALHIANREEIVHAIMRLQMA